MDALVGGDCLVFGSFRLEPRSGRLLRQDATGGWVPVPIGSRALDILGVLLNRPGAVVSKDAIMDAVWPRLAVEPNNLTVQIAALRRVLDEGHNGESCIQTVPGRGYRLVLDVTQAPEAHPAPPPVPVAEPVAEIQAPARSGPLIRRWRSAAAGAVTIIALLLIAAWHGGWLSGTPAPHRLSLVVLPFTNFSGDPKDDYLADGVTDDLTSDLAHIPGAFVIASASAYSYRGKPVDIRQVGSELGVRFAVQGSVRRLGPTLRVDLQLVSTETGAQLWSDRFDQALSDLAEGQEAAVIRMRSALDITLTDIAAARSLRDRPTNPDAFDLILRARAIRNQPVTAASNAEALRLFELALEHDPDSVIALGYAVILLTDSIYYGTLPRWVALDRAAPYLDRAQKIAPNSELVLTAKAALLDWQDRFAQLADTAERLIENFPNSPAGYFRLAVTMKFQGRYEDAIVALQASIRLNPRSPVLRNRFWNLAFCSVQLGRDSEGIAWAQRALNAEGTLPREWHSRLLLYQAAAYARTGDLDAGRRAVAEAERIDPFDTVRQHSHFMAWAVSANSRAQMRRVQAAMRLAGHRDHADPDADFGTPSDSVLHDTLQGQTPIDAPGVTRIGSAELVTLLG